MVALWLCYGDGAWWLYGYVTAMVCGGFMVMLWRWCVVALWLCYGDGVWWLYGLVIVVVCSGFMVFL